MKKVIKFIFFIFYIPLTVQGQKAETTPVQDYYNPLQLKRNVFKTSIFTPLWGPIFYTSEYRLVYEFISAKDQSCQVAASYLGESPFTASLLYSDTTYNNIKLQFNGYRLQATYKFYINQFAERIKIGKYQYAPYGWYIAPHLSFASVKITDANALNQDYYINITHFNINALIGYQFFALEDVLAVDFFVGLGYKNNTWIEHDASNQISVISTTFMNTDLNGNPNLLGRFYNSPVKIYLGFNVGIGLN